RDRLRTRAAAVARQGCLPWPPPRCRTSSRPSPDLLHSIHVENRVGASLHDADPEDPDRVPLLRRLVRDQGGARAGDRSARVLGVAALASPGRAAAAPRRPAREPRSAVGAARAGTRARALDDAVAAVATG